MRRAALTLLAIGLAVAPAHAAQFVYVTNESSSVSQYEIGAGGLLTPLSPPMVAAVSSPQEGVAVTPNGRSVYVTSFAPSGAGQVLQYDVDPGGHLSPKTPPAVPAGHSPRLITVSPDGRSAYAADLNFPGSVLQYDIDAAGRLSPKTPASVPARAFTFGVVVSPDGKSVYATNFELFDSTVSQYDVRADGTLVPKTPASVPVGNGPTGIAVSPDGRSVYVANFQGASMSQFDVGAGGGLTAKTPATIDLPGAFPRIIGITPDGRHVYVTDVDHGVLRFGVTASGGLVPQGLTPAGEIPDGLALSRDGRSLYVANQLDDNVSQFDIGGSGALTPKSPPTVVAGRFPSGVAIGTPRPITKDECKNGGWRKFEVFKNQGACVSFVAHQPG
jgi:DNA-binding beta-propeller fold protein YncE